MTALQGIYSGKNFYVTKFITCSIFSWFVWRCLNTILHEYQHTGNLNYINSLLLVAETVTFLVILFGRAPKDFNVSLKSMFYAAAGTYYLIFISLSDENTRSLINPNICGSMIFLAILWQIAAKLSLGRSFGIIPANRNVVSGGMYKLMRHPIYFGYLIGHVGFLLGAFSLWNLGIFAVLYVFQVLRIIEEEKVLSRDPSYIAYKNDVHYRLIPGLF